MPRLPGLIQIAVLLLAAACSRSPTAAASTTNPPAAKALASTQVPAPPPTDSRATIPKAAVPDTATLPPPESHLLDDDAAEPAQAIDPVPPEANAAGSALLVPGRPRKPLVHAASETPAIAPIGGEIPDGPEALPGAPLQSCTDPRPTACNLDYKPVCAEVDTGVRCITTPCPSSERKTFGSSCKACRDPKVTAYVSGTCPKG